MTKEKKKRENFSAGRFLWWPFSVIGLRWEMQRRAAVKIFNNVSFGRCRFRKSIFCRDPVNVFMYFQYISRTFYPAENNRCLSIIFDIQNYIYIDKVFAWRFNKTSFYKTSRNLIRQIFLCNMLIYRLLISCWLLKLVMNCHF